MEMNCCKDGICTRGEFCQAKYTLDEADVEPAGEPSPWWGFMRDCVFLALSVGAIAFLVGVVAGVHERLG